MAEKVFFIINKFAGTGFEATIEGSIINACAQLNLEGTLEYTSGKGHATRLAWQAVDAGYSRVFAMGGDGTVNEVAQGLVHTKTAMGIIPAGSGNGLARHLQIPLKFGDALSLMDQFQIIDMDTLLVNERLSINVSGIGFDGHIADKFAKNGRRGLAGYTSLVVKEFRKFREFEVQAMLDHEPWHQKAFIIAIANSSQFGNNARVAPFASVCDGLMDICFIHKVPFTHMVGFLSKMFFGRIVNSNFVEMKKCTHFTASFPKPAPYHIDGESQPPLQQFVVTMQPRSLKMIVPAITKTAI